MPKLTIDGMELDVASGTSVLQACEQLGVEIPRFCYHDRLSVPANCRMCLVELEGAPKPIASCAMPCADNMVIKTTSEVTLKARKGVMEFLLINHPLDCPICDQGGECDLQDQAMGYGFDRGRYVEMKRAVSDKYMGPLIKPFMTRCIHCTRCVRFGDEIAGVSELGMTGRSEHVEITTYIGEAIHSELSGNMIDICPVGALTSKPYAFAARPWELKKTESIDVMDAVGSNIRVDARGGEVLRILPRLNEDVNEEWLGDKSRFAYDGLKRQRLDRPYLRVDGKLTSVSWEDALDVAAARIKATAPDRMAAIVGDLVDCESTKALHDLMTGIGVKNLDCRQDGAAFDTREPAGYLFNSGIAGIEQADAILIVGGYLRWEAPLINARIRKRFLTGNVKVAIIGESHNYSYPYQHLGEGTQSLADIAAGAGVFADTLRNAQRPMVIISASIFAQGQGQALQRQLYDLSSAYNLVREGWNGFNVVHTAAGRVGALTLGFVPKDGGRDFNAIVDGAEKGAIDLVYLLGADEFDTDRLGRAFVVYQGHHGDRGAHRADLILPGAAYTEKSATYINTEGRVQRANFATFPPGEAREDWKIVRALANYLGQTLPYDSLAELRREMKLGTFVAKGWGEFGTKGDIAPASFISPIANYYMTDPISRASVTMAQCTEEFITSDYEAAAE